MGEFVTKALVLHRSDYGDADRMVTLLTPENGLIDAIARGCRRTRSPLMNSTEAFTYGEYSLYSVRDRTEIRTCDIIDAHYDLRSDFDRLEAGAYWLRLLKTVSPHGTDCRDIFLMSLESLAYLSLSDLPVQLLTFSFESRLLALIGLAPRLDKCGKCGKPVGEEAFFDPAAGGILCRDCAGYARVLSPMARRILKKLPVSSFRNLGLLLGKPEWTEAAAHIRHLVTYEVDLPGDLPPLSENT